MNPSRPAYAAVYPHYVGAQTVLMGPAPLPPTPRIPTVTLPGATAYMSPPSTPRSHHSAPGSLPPSPPQFPSPHRATVPPYPPYPSPRSTPTSFQIHAALLYAEPHPHRTPVLPCEWNAALPPSSATVRLAGGQPADAVLARPASQPPLAEVILVSDALPPSARIALSGSGSGGVLVVRDFLAGLHQLLYEPLSAVDLQLVPPARRARIHQNAAARRDNTPRRIDWLDGRTRFVGFSTYPHAARTFVAHFA